MDDLPLRPEATAAFEQIGAKTLRRMIDAMRPDEQNGKYTIPNLGSLDNRFHSCEAQTWLKLKENPKGNGTSI